MKKLIFFIVSGMLLFSTGANAQVTFYEHYKYCSTSYDLFPVIVKCSLDRRSMYLKNNPDHRSFIGDSFDAFLLVTEEKLQNKRITAAEAKLLTAEKLMNLEEQVRRANNQNANNDDFTNLMRNLGAVTDDLQRREQQRIDQYYNRGAGSGTTCTTQKVGQSYKTVCN
jgi:hypothetical protein